MRLTIIAGLFVLGLVPASAQSLRTEDLVGRWGVAAYWSDTDAANVTRQARGFCSQPYVISKGPNGGAMMFEAFEGRPREMVVRSGEIIAADGGNPRVTKSVASWNGQVLVFSYNDPEPKRKYGNMVFARCGR
ncbi:MAG: hypothetical protein ACRC7G_02175 [Beijerinckiaceae bacterium]